MAERIQRSRAKGWRMPEGAVYVGRPSRWGNPFPVMRRGGELFSAEDAVRMYREWVTTGEAWFGEHRLVGSGFRRPADLEPLCGRDLACWCPLDQPCHADVLLELANR